MFYIILFQKQYLIKTIIKQTIFIMLVVRNSVFWREMTRFGNYLTRKLTNFSKDFVNSISLPLSSAEQFGANKRLSLRQRHGWERQKVTKKETKGWGWPRPRENWRVSLFISWVECFTKIAKYLLILLNVYVCMYIGMYVLR